MKKRLNEKGGQMRKSVLILLVVGLVAGLALYGCGAKKAESFNDKVAKSNVLDLLNMYEKQDENIPTNGGYDLHKQMNANSKCKSVNLNDYVDRRVGQCNCDLSQL